MRKQKKINDRKFTLSLEYNETYTGGELLEPGKRWSDRATKYITVDFKQCYFFLTEHYKNKTTSKDMVVGFNPITADNVYIVVVRFYDGDTFGRTEGLWNAAHATISLKTATKIKNQILAGAGIYHKSKYQPWHGYFAGIQSVDIHKFKVLIHV